MMLIDSLAEQRILSAIREGEFDSLSGHGKPLHLEVDSHLPESMRGAYRVLKNAGCIPPELMLQREIHALERLLDRAADERPSIQRRLELLRVRLALSGRQGGLLVQEGRYRIKLEHRITRHGL